KPARLEALLKAVTIGKHLTPEQNKKVTDTIIEFADCFALSVGEVFEANDAVHELNIPPGTKFSTKVPQREFNPPRRAHVNKSVDELLEADIIEAVDPSKVKAVLPITLVQKAH
ncbi:hypothetical protein PENSPDRAFT_542750, partial [Peniophora sp. CONT]